jgi:hypothetical protein
MKNEYSVIVGNIGMVYSGRNRDTAHQEFNGWREQALDTGRGQGEPVTLLCNGEPLAESVLYSYEYTDTFGGEANYCWVKRGKVHARNVPEAVKLAKLELGLSGVRCERSDMGETVALYPRNSATVLFINYAGE